MAVRHQTRFKLLLAIAAGSTTLALGLAGLFALRWAEIRSLRADLLARTELQSELLSQTDSDHLIFPHVDRAIGFVLNPHLGHGTWRAVEGRSYRINSLGLRGDEIGPKPPGTRRILLVGDSVVFGWKLSDEQTIEAATEALLAAKQAGPIEVVTVALPNWNVVSENAFLRAHLPLLEPDFIIWSVLLNDCQDVAGAVPPGVLQGFASPQARLLAPFTRTRAGFHRVLDMPFVVSRWRGILALIRDFQAEHTVPTALMWWRAPMRPYLEHVLRQLDYRPPRIAIPDEYKRDDRWRLGPSDLHPSSWATERLALAIAGLLADSGFLPDIEFDRAESEIIAKFRAEAARTPSSETIREFLAQSLARVPTVLGAGTPEKAVLFGIEGDAMLKEGVVYLRASIPAPAIGLELELPASGSPAPMKAHFEVLERSGGRASRSATLGPGAVRIELPLPPTDDPQRVFEVRWKFDHAFCSGPGHCQSAVLRRLAFVGTR